MHSLDLMLSDPDYDRYLSLNLNQDTQTEGGIYFQLIFITEMIEYLMKTIDGRSINRYLERVGEQVKKIISDAPLKLVEKYIEDEKSLITQNIEIWTKPIVNSFP